jgi:hypothetical protein
MRNDAKGELDNEANKISPKAGIAGRGRSAASVGRGDVRKFSRVGTRLSQPSRDSKGEAAAEEVEGAMLTLPTGTLTI